MTQSDTLREKAVRYHVIADTILDDDASVDLHEAAAILEQQAERLDKPSGGDAKA